jgi:hypothetical protein
MEPKFKMASIEKKCKILLAVMYLFLCRFGQIKPFPTCHTQVFYIIDKKIKGGSKIQDGVHTNKKLILFWLSLADLNKYNHFGLDILNSFILLIKKIKGGTEIQDGVNCKKL